MFKSCDYCRHRKKRCVVADGASGRCSDCEHLDLPCEFSQRRPSLKRRQTSRHIAARVAAERQQQQSLSPVLESDAFSHDGGRRRVQVDSLSGKINKTLLERQARRDGDTSERRNSTEGETLFSRYVHDVRPFLPYVPDEFFLDDDLESNLLSDCIRRACALSLNMMHAQPAGDPAVLDTAVASQPSLSLSDAAGLLLLIPCMPLADATVERVLDTIASGPHHYPEVLAGAISTQTWKQLVYRPSTHLALPTNMLHTFALSLDERSFARHYLLLADLGTRFQQQTQQTQLDPESAHLAWAKLEYECLLWQVRLPPHLLDLRDELPATPESLVIHQLSSLVLLSLYSHILDNPELGRSVALRPVPGVLYFMCALARSVFICPRAVLDRWELVVDIRATTARILLRLWHQTRFENCRAILAMWTDIEPQHEALAAQIQREIGTGPWTVDEIDGYSVFWTFRDLRALTLELIVQKEKQELHA